jgi:hypothetical protein
LYELVNARGRGALKSGLKTGDSTFWHGEGRRRSMRYREYFWRLSFAVSIEKSKLWRRGELNPSSYRDKTAVWALYKRNMNKFISLIVSFNRSKKNVRVGEI